MSPNTPRILVALASAGIVAALLTGCSIIQQVLGGGDATRDESGQVIEGNDASDVFLMRVGDCINDQSLSGEVSNVPIVPCSELHDSEIYDELRLTGTDYPGDDAVGDQAWAYCEEAFAEFAGIAYADSVLDFYPFTPTQGSWEGANDRLVSCVIYDTAGQVTGTLAGAAR